jgi:ankyrin repeat protein
MDKMTPLMYAAMAGRTENIKFLLNSFNYVIS